MTNKEQCCGNCGWWLKENNLCQWSTGPVVPVWAPDLLGDGWIMWVSEGTDCPCWKERTNAN